MRVEVIEAYSERRDCLDQRWFELAKALGVTAIPLPNLPPGGVAELLDTLPIRLVVLSGGNSICSLNPNAADAAPERDAFESELMTECTHRDLPVMGVCRGLQMMNTWAGGTLSPIENHAGTRHSLRCADDAPSYPDQVNSYHNWAVSSDDLAPGLVPLAWDVNGNVEAFRHSKHNMHSIMWHPEREPKLDPRDLALFRDAISEKHNQTPNETNEKG